MEKLKNAIMRSFIFYFFVISIIGDLIDELIYELDAWAFGSDYQLVSPIVATLAQVVALLLFSFLFYRSLTKKIGQESLRLAKKQSQLFANIAHDLKTPLTSITGFSKALNEEIVEPEEIKEVSGIIYQKSVTANELLDLMFQYTKLNAAEFRLKREECDVNYLLKEVIAANYDLLESHQIELLLELPEEPLFRMIDPTEFNRVFSNLLINACKHNPPKTKPAISIAVQKDITEIIFADNGNPIPYNEREKLFQPFISESESERSFQGNGLGLAIVKTIVEKHGFKIALLDGEEYTKRFVITI
ncbi:sensor histidine kinase [Enterococcus devriesei]|uniref:sensor histidine kinase n=1 Tax=Enterococcus devriesei TaxID=319970 RepID=UPI0036D3B805